MRYRRIYQETHDIDFFFKYKNRFFHAASNGGTLPDGIDSRINRIIQEIIEDNEYGLEIHLEAILASNYTDYYDVEDDLSSFLRYAALGFISLDRTCNDSEFYEDHPNSEINKVYVRNGNRYEYHVVARPEKTRGNIIPYEVLRRLPDLSEIDITITGLEE